MKLANYLTIRLSGLFIIILFIWSLIYFFFQMTEIYDGIDEGLNNLKQELILQANKTPGYIDNIEKYDPINLILEKISREEAVNIKETYSNSEIYFPSEQEYEEVRILTTAFRCTLNDQYYKVTIFTSTVESDDMIENIFILLLSLWIFLSFVLIIATKIIIQRSNKPFYILLDKLKQFRLNEGQMVDLPSTSIYEYSALTLSVKELLEKNINIYSEQKNFIENASHELQTPIAIVINKLELLMNDEKITQKQLEELNAIINNLNRVKRLNSSLLLISKIRNKQFKNFGTVDFHQIIKEILDNFELLIKHKELTVNIEINGNPSIVMNQDLSFILINNLLKNAISHNVKSGMIKIVLNDNSLTISNTGTPIPDNIDIFKRYIFHENNTSSSGLGLSIVKSIADLYNMKIKHQYFEGIHTIKLNLNTQ